jgi:hypothetical protein
MVQTVIRQLFIPEVQVFIPGAVYQRFVVDKMTLDMSCSEFFGFLFSLSLYQCFIFTDLSITDAIVRNI